MVKECLQKAVVLYAGLELEILSYTQDQQNIGIMYVVHYTEMLKGCKFLLVIRSIRLTYNLYNNTKYSKDIIERISRV